MYRPTTLPRAEALAWWRDDRCADHSPRSAVGINEVECRLCLAEAGAPRWSVGFKIRLRSLWPSALDHLLRQHGVVIEPAECPGPGE